MEKCEAALLGDVKDHVKCLDVKIDALPTRTQIAVHVSLIKQSVELSCIPGKNWWWGMVLATCEIALANIEVAR